MSINNVRKVIIFETPHNIVNFVFELWLDTCQEAINKRGMFVVALCAGRTLPPLYKELGENLQVKIKDSFFKKTHIFFVDERFVPHHHHDSNYRAIKDSFLGWTGIPKTNIHTTPIRETSVVSAQSYEENIKEFFQLKNERLPSFDLIILGLGEDGHTASLFPANKVLLEKQRLVKEVVAEGVNYERITMTLPVINNARNAMFVVTGENKAKVVREILEDKNTNFPASLVKPKGGGLLFLLDSKAGSLLEQRVKSKE